MSWQQRGQQRYYYKSLRVGGGRVRCLYFGSGPAAELAAVEDQLHRLELVEARERRQAALARQRAADAALDRLCEMTSLLARAALLAAGYHQHARGPWRRSSVPTNHTGAG